MDCFGVTEQVTCTTKYTEGRKRQSTHFRMFHNNRQITVSTLQFITIGPHTIMHYLKTIYTATITALKYICNILLQPDICVFFQLEYRPPDMSPCLQRKLWPTKTGTRKPKLPKRTWIPGSEWRDELILFTLCATALLCFLLTWDLKTNRKMLCEEQQHCLDVVMAGHNLVILGQVGENDESLPFIL